MEFDRYLEKIESVDDEDIARCRAHWNQLTHPVGSLGRLEAITCRLGAIQRRVIPQIENKGLLVMCADNGVVAEGISSSPQEFTQLLANAMARGETGVAVLSRVSQTELTVVDVGMLRTVEREAGIVPASIREGTGNIRIEDAMTRGEAVRAIEAGISIATRAIGEGVDILGTGELGIGNTTTSSAILYALTGSSITDCVGYGAGITDKQLKRKQEVVKEAVEKRLWQDPIDLLASVGGLDIAALVGVFLAGARHRVPVVIDGLITGVAALVATEMKACVKDYIFSSHRSAEKSFGLLTEIMDLHPPLDLSMRLGEGSGCPLLFQLLDSAVACMRDMGTVGDNQIDPGRLVPLGGAE